MISNKAVKKELSKRAKAFDPISNFKLEDHLFKEQLDFVLDPAKNKVAVCSRRAGKTTACAADLIYTAINNPGTNSLYITLSRNNAKRLVWKELKYLNRKYKLNGQENLSELSIHFPEPIDSTIYLSGAKDSTEIEKFRGMALKLVYIDEIQSFRDYVKDLITDVLSPARLDYAGTISLTGTPGAIPAGFFYDTYSKPNNWSKHHWTFWNNPFITKKSKQTHQQMLQDELDLRGVKSDDPSIQREYFGKFVQDSDSLLLHYADSVNHYDVLPIVKYNYIMGIDLGFDDADAIAVIAWSENDPTTYLVDELVVPNQGLTELVKQIQFFQKKYDISKMVIDQGGLGKKLAEEMRRQHGIPVEAADKARKMENVAFLNDALRTGRFKAKNDSRFAKDSYLVEIDRAKSRPDKLVVSANYHSDIIDAVLYSFKESPAFSYQPPVKKLKPGTKEYYDSQVDDMFEAELAGITQEYEAAGLIKNGYSSE